MEYRELGETGEKLSVVGVGCWAAGGYGWGGTDDEKTTDAFHAALDLGVNLFDTAPVYGFGHAERVLGEGVLKQRRDQVYLATKFGLVWSKESFEGISNNLEPDSIKCECDASLKRLGTDRIDLYQAHWPLQGGAMTQAATDDMMAALNDLRDAGKIRQFGVSNFSVEQMEMVEKAGRKPASLQPPFSILRPGAGRELIPWCEKHKVGVLCYSPLLRGLLTGKYKGDETFPEDDSRSKHPDYSGERFREICNRVQQLSSWAKDRDTTIAGIALGWVLNTPGVTSALCGTRHRGQIEETAKHSGVKLTPEERCQISGLFEGVSKIL